MEAKWEPDFIDKEDFRDDTEEKSKMPSYDSDENHSFPADVFLGEDPDKMTGEDSVLSLIFWLPVLSLLFLLNNGLTVVSWPVLLFLDKVFGLEINPISFGDLSPTSKKQAAIVGSFAMLIPLSLTSYWVALSMLLFPVTTIPMAYYIYYIYKDTAPQDGSRDPFLRYWPLWRHFAGYFPMTLVRTKELDPKGKYVFCYHPHGVISVGAFGNFATDATGFSKKFPGIDIRVLTLQLNFWAPWTRELLLSIGMCSASRKSCDQILQRGPGSAIMLVVGGAAESLDAAPGTYRLTLSRQGFVKVALDNNACLVPVLGFGETDVFDTYVYPRNSPVRWFQEKFKSAFGFTLPVFHGRGIFNSTFGFMPHRKPIYAVVGAPLKLPHVPPHLKGKLSDTKEGRAIVDEYHQRYIKSLVNLYHGFKNTYTVNRSESLKIVGTGNKLNSLSLRMNTLPRSQGRKY